MSTGPSPSVRRQHAAYRSVPVVAERTRVPRQDRVVHEVGRHCRCGGRMCLHHLRVEVERRLDDFVGQISRQILMRYRKIIEADRLIAL